MSMKNIKFSFEETEEGFIIKLEGADKEKLKAKLEALEAYINYREKAAQAGFGPHGAPGIVHSFFKTMYEAHADYCGGHGAHGGHGRRYQHPYHDRYEGHDPKGDNGQNSQAE